MNSLSWMIYAAEVFNNLGMFLGLVGFGGLLIIILTAGFSGLLGVAGDEDKLKQASVRAMRKIWMPVVALALSVVIPSSQTIYLIAASEAGATVISNPEMKEVFNDLKTIIKSKLKEQLPKT